MTTIPTGPRPAPQHPAQQRHARRALPPLPADRPAGPHLAVADDHRGAALALHRPARRQPGADRPDDAGPQAHDVRAAGADGLQGDRGRLPVRLRDRLRLRAPAHRGRPDPRRRHDLGADPGPRGPDRAQRAVAGRRAPRQHPPLQRAGPAVPPRRLPRRQGRGQGDRDPRHRDGDEVRRVLPRHDHDRLRVLARRSSPPPSCRSASRCARRSPTCGSPRTAARSSSTCPRPWSRRRRTSTPTRSSGSPAS